MNIHLEIQEINPVNKELNELYSFAREFYNLENEGKQDTPKFNEEFPNFDSIVKQINEFEFEKRAEIAEFEKLS